MKKLLIAASATACALGAFAASFTDTKATFESLAEGAALDVTKDDLGNPVGTTGTSAQWYTADAAGLETKVAAYATAPADGNAKYLNIESTSKPLYRLVHGMVTPDVAEAKTADMGEVYIDTLVQFTAGDPEMAAEEAGAKLALWVCGNDADGNPAATTNFMVKAGCFVDGEFKSATYTMLPATDMTFEKDAWYRLTVKTIANVGHVGESQIAYQGFVVFVNGVALEPQGYNALASLTGGAYDNRFADAIVLSMQNNDATLAAVGFSGTGAIDEVAFTSTAPNFADDAKKFTLTWTEGVASITYGDVTIDMGDTDKSVELDVVAGKTIDVTYEVGYVADWTAPEIKAGATVDVKAALAGCSYVDAQGKTVFAKTLADALDKAAGAKVTLSVDAELEEAYAVESGNVSIDLAGKTIFGAFTVSGGSLTIDDSVGGGKVVAEETVITFAGGVTKLLAGSYDGEIAFDSDEEFSLELLQISNGVKVTSADVADLLAETQELSELAGDGYYTVKAIGPTETPTVTPGAGSVEVEAESEAAAAAQVEITVPTDVVAGLNDATEQENYKTNFVVKATAVEGQSGKYTVEVVLREDIEAAIEEKATEAAEAGLAKVLDPTSDSNEVTVTGVINGFYYSVETGTTLDGMKERGRTMATGGSVTLNFPKEANDKARFYKVKVNLGPESEQN